MTTKEHIHHWLCEPPNGEWAAAVCKHCGEESKFRNSPEHVTAWQRRANIEKGHGLSKSQLKTALDKKGELMPDYPRELENDITKKERVDAKQSTAKNTQ
jgi:hypothetical protein|tara:strand:- start:59 stop:358 length:300 start_codon:yes stop_codon:yes gene_type:complete